MLFDFCLFVAFDFAVWYTDHSGNTAFLPERNFGNTLINRGSAAVNHIQRFSGVRTMRKEFFNRRKNSFDFYMVNCGYEDCCPRFVCPPQRRSYYLIHYVVRGTCLYEVGGQMYEIHEGGIFLIYPGELVTYSSPDIEQPLTFCWIGFTGDAAKAYLAETGLPPHTYTFFLNDHGFSSNIQNCLDSIEDANDTLSQFQLNRFLLKALDLIRSRCTAPKKTRQPSTVADRAVRYIEFNYMNGIRPHDIVEYLSIDRTYFYRIFKKYTGSSPEQYLTQYRIRKAIELIQEKRYSVTEISQYIGMSDIYQFSKMFKKVTGKSPQTYIAELKS